MTGSASLESQRCGHARDRACTMTASFALPSERRDHLGRPTQPFAALDPLFHEHSVRRVCGGDTIQYRSMWHIVGGPW